MIQPYMPPEGRLVAPQLRLLRTAGAFLDPEIQLGSTTREEAKRVREEVLLSDGMIELEIARYNFQNPGQAGSCFYGDSQLRRLSDEVARGMGRGFDQQALHYYVLDQGVLPITMLTRTVAVHFLKPAATGQTPRR